VRVAVAVYRLASRALPREFRAAYGVELEDCFRGIASETRWTRGRLAVVGVLVRSVADLAGRAPVEHLNAARSGALGAGGGWRGVWQDVRHAVRRLRRSPSFTLASVLTLALGIGATVSVFTLVHGVVLSPLPYPESDRIVVVDHGAPGLGFDRGLGITYGFFRFYSGRSSAAETMAMYAWTEQPVTGHGEPVRMSGVRTTPSLGAVLRVRPALGRWLTEADAEPGAAGSVVLSHGFWQERFGGDPGALGEVLEINGAPFEVVGVMPARFAFPDRDAAFWLPRTVPTEGVGGWNDMAVARLADGADEGTLERELRSSLPVFREITDDPDRLNSYLDEAKVTPRVVSLKETVVGGVRSTLWILLGTVGFVLLIAVANVANLFLVRAEEGRREIAVRTALGAFTTRLARGFVAETLVLTGAAGVLGVAAATLAIRVLRVRAPVNVPRLEEVALDPTVGFVAAGVCLAAALLLGLIPVVRHALDPTPTGVALREGSGRTTAGRGRLRGRNLLMAVQVGLALVLLVGSGLLYRTFRELRAVDPGFGLRQALTFEVGLPASRYADRASGIDFHSNFLQELRALPGVESAAAVGHCLPLAPHMCWGETLEADGQPVPAGEVPPVTGARVATEGYFSTMRIPVRGRPFGSGDRSGPGQVAILSEAAAAAYFPDVEALGRRVRFGPESPWLTVVGVAGNVRSRIGEDDAQLQRVIYLPLNPAVTDGPPPSPLVYVLATPGRPAALAGPARAALARLDPTIPLAEVRSLERHLATATAPTAFALTLIGLAAAVALLLGAIGVYAVIAYAVSRRTGEIGVRMALGARAADVRRMVLRQGAVVVAAGIGLGLAGSFVLTRLMEGMLFGVGPTDVVSYATVTALMAVVAGVALWIPAVRATRVDPMESLRGD
jgi:putative ABC transport system permease protein